MDYKTTLNLPDTSFPMRGNLPNREPEIIEQPTPIGDGKETASVYHYSGTQRKKARNRLIAYEGP